MFGPLNSTLTWFCIDVESDIPLKSAFTGNFL